MHKTDFQYYGTIMQIEKALISDGLRVSKAFFITIIYNFAVIYSLTLQFSLKVAYFLTVSIAISVYKQNSNVNVM